MPEPELREKDFIAISRYIQEKFGIVLKEEKKELVKTRLSRRVAQLGYATYGDYLDYVQTNSGEDERVEMVNAISTNLTSFYREAKHFTYLRGEVLPALIKANRGKSFKLRGWCTAASSGEEPYTIIMEVLDTLADTPGCDFKLLATDISTKMLDRAKTGVYNRLQTEDVPSTLLEQYFLKGKGQSSTKVKAKDLMKEKIHFSYLNLVNPFPISKPLDFIFCRNVMIYFDDVTRQQIITRFIHLLKPGGFLFMGMSEGLSGIQHSLKYVAPSIYRKG